MNSEYMNLFVEEARENIDELIAGLLRLESEDDSSAGHTINELFRFAHNVKGMAATVGLDAITVVAHRTEDLLDRFRQASAKPDSATIDLFLSSADALSEMIDAVAAGDDPEPNDEVLTQLESRMEETDQPAGDSSAPAPKDQFPDEPAEGTTFPETVDPVPAIVTSAPAPAPGTHRIAVKLVDGCALAGARAAIVLRSVTARTTIEKTYPTESEITSGKLTEFVLDVATDAKLDELIAAILDITDVAAAIVVDPPRQDEPDQPQQTKNPAKSPKNGRSAAQRATVRVEVERLDDLMNLVGELVIGRGQLEGHVRRIADGGLNDTAQSLTRTISDLYAAVARARMISLEGTFNRLNRLVRDTARELGKDVDFHMEGADTELDRSMIDEVADPLVHLLRNALDHGVEPPGERDAAKPATARVSLTARYEGNQVVIEVSDDGSGIDGSRVAAKAVEKGLIDAAEIEEMTEDELVQLVFLPGLSTRETASTISGRGVGMDVVKSSVAKLGGSVDVGSVPGTGSTFRIRLPLSLAVVETLLVSVHDQTWAVPLADIDETIVVDQDDLESVLGSPVVNLRGQTVPLVHGREALALADPPVPPFPAVVFKSKGQRRALSVDHLIEQSEVVVKPAPDALRSVEHVSGVTILGDGTVGLIVDVDSVTEKNSQRLRRGHLVSA